MPSRDSCGKTAELEEDSGMGSTWMSPFAELSTSLPSSLADSASFLFPSRLWQPRGNENVSSRLWTFYYSLVTQAKQFHILSGLPLLYSITILLVLSDIGGERSICPNSGSFVWIAGKTHGPTSSAINLGADSFSCPGRAVNIREKSSLLKCREQILECFVGFQWARLRSTKSIHFFRLLQHSLLSSPKNGILCRSIPFSGSALLLQPYTTQLSGITKSFFSNRRL